MAADVVGWMGKTDKGMPSRHSGRSVGLIEKRAGTGRDLCGARGTARENCNGTKGGPKGDPR